MKKTSNWLGSFTRTELWTNTWQEGFFAIFMCLSYVATKPWKMWYSQLLCGTKRTLRRLWRHTPSEKELFESYWRRCWLTALWLFNSPESAWEIINTVLATCSSIGSGTRKYSKKEVDKTSEPMGKKIMSLFFCKISRCVLSLFNSGS